MLTAAQRPITFLALLMWGLVAGLLFRADVDHYQRRVLGSKFSLQAAIAAAFK